MTDQELIEEIKNGNIGSSHNAMRQLYKTCFPMTKYMVCKNNGSVSDAEDIFQDTMIIVYNKVKQVDFSLTSKLSTYVSAVSKNLWLKHLRDNKVSANNLKIDDFKLASLENIHESLEFTEQQVMLGKLLMTSGQKCYDILKAFYFEKLRIKKIAKLFNYSSEQIVRTQKMRCLKKLRTLMKNNLEYNELKSYNNN